MSKIPLWIILALTFIFLAGCTTNVKDQRKNRSSYSAALENAMVMYTISGKKYGPLLIYKSSSFISGSPMLKRNPKTKIAKAAYGDVALHAYADGLGPAGTQAVIDFSERFVGALTEQRQSTWQGASKRKFNFHLYYIPREMGFSRTKTGLLFNQTFDLHFYHSVRFSLAARSITKTLSHESYHLESSKIGSHIRPKQKLKISKILHRLLDEVAASVFGSCTSLRSEGNLLLKEVSTFPIKRPIGPLRKGTMTDKQMRGVLDLKQTKIADARYELASAMYLSLWTHYAGSAERIDIGSPAADKFLELCATSIAHPHDIWPVLWELAHDGKDAPEMPLTVKSSPKSS